MRSKVAVCTTWAFLLVLIWWLVHTGKGRMADNPLIAAGMPEALVRRYLYLFALNRYCFPDDNEHPTEDKATALQFLQQTGMVMCPVCHRYYVTDVRYCYDDANPTIAMTDDAAQRQIEIWEAFRKSYIEQTGIKTLTRYTTITLHHAMMHARAR